MEGRFGWFHLAFWGKTPLKASPWSSVGLKPGILARFSTSLCFPRLWEAGSKRGKETTTCAVLSPPSLPHPYKCKSTGSYLWASEGAALPGTRQPWGCAPASGCSLCAAPGRRMGCGYSWGAQRGQGWLCFSISLSGAAGLVQFALNAPVSGTSVEKAQGKKAFACSKCTKPRREQEQATGRHKRKT